MRACNTHSAKTLHSWKMPNLWRLNTATHFHLPNLRAHSHFPLFFTLTLWHCATSELLAGLCDGTYFFPTQTISGIDNTIHNKENIELKSCFVHPKDFSVGCCYIKYTCFLTNNKKLAANDTLLGGGADRMSKDCSSHASGTNRNGSNESERSQSTAIISSTGSWMPLHCLQYFRCGGQFSISSKQQYKHANNNECNWVYVWVRIDWADKKTREKKLTSTYRWTRALNLDFDKYQITFSFRSIHTVESSK